MRKLNSHTIKILILSLLFVAVFCVSISTSSARFATLISTDSAARGAKWWFVVSYDSNDVSAWSGDTFTINLADTRTDSKSSLIKNTKVAPGASGEFEITIDCSGCETTSNYNLTLSQQYQQDTYPNIVFYTGVKGTASYSQIVLGSTVLSGTILENTSNHSQQVATVLIKWEWPINLNLNENEFMGNQYPYVCNITASQVIS